MAELRDHVYAVAEDSGHRLALAAGIAPVEEALFWLEGGGQAPGRPEGYLKLWLEAGDLVENTFGVRYRVLGFFLDGSRRVCAMLRRPGKDTKPLDEYVGYILLHWRLLEG